MHRRSTAPPDVLILLRKWRNDAKLTQRALGKRLRKPHTFVHKSEVGSRRIDPIEFIDWCKACGVSPTAAIAGLARRVR